MSDIQEEQKRLYKRAEENDIKVTKMVIDKPLIHISRDIDKLRKENKKLKDRINKAVEYINKYCEDYIIEDNPDPMCLFYGEDGRYKPEAKQELLDILKGKE